MNDWHLSDDEIRAFFGEQEGDHDEPRPHWTPQPATVGRREYGHAGWRQAHIADGRCPMPGCHHDLDEDQACARCGWSLLEEKMRERIAAIEDRPDYLPTLPLALDEWAPAQVSEDAA